MRTINIKWLYFGTISLTLISFLFISSGTMNPFIPTPFYMLFLGWIISYGVVFVFPLLYVINLKMIANNSNFAKITLIVSLVLSFLNLFYLLNSWEDGIVHQDLDYLKIVVVENIFGFSSLIVLAYFGIKRKNKEVQYFANLLVFILLAWCAFPYLGELP